MNNWDKTRKNFIDWLSDSELRTVFSKKILYKNLSIWWLTNLMDKDHYNQQEWYENLNKKLHYEDKKKLSEKLNFFLLFFHLIKNFILKLVSIFFIKIFFRRFKRTKKFKKKNSFYSLYTNCVEFKGNFIDRQYGLASLKNIENKSYIIELPENYFLIKNYFKIKKNLKKIPVEFIISNQSLKFIDIFKIYFFCLTSLFKLFNILKSKNYFIINNINCRDILENKLIKSFFGSIQEQLLRGLALEKSLKNSHCDNFINCFDFHPQARAFYYFANNSNVKNVININHVNYSENNIFLNFNKRDFSGDYSCPKPNVFFSQGERYFNFLKKIFLNDKIYCLGSLKPELNKFQIEPRNINNANKSQQIFTILCSIIDYKSIVKIINECQFKNIIIYVAPHPLKKLETIKYFQENLKINFINASDENKNELFVKSDYIIFGDTSLGLELALKNYKVLRLYSSDFIPTFDIDDEIPTATNKDEFLEIINKEQISQKTKQIEKNYFYKYDMQGSERLDKILNELN